MNIMRRIACISMILLGISGYSIKANSPLSPLAPLPAPDTLDMAKGLRDAGKLKASLTMLEAYFNAHPTDLNAGWVYAQTAYWAKRFDLSRKIYDLTIWYHPENLYLQADYANMLVSIGKQQEAVPYLEHFLEYYPDNLDVQRTLARISYYNGEYKEAWKQLSAVEKRSPGDPQTKTLMDEILLAKSPWIRFSGVYYDDSQPLQSIAPVIESNLWLHPLSTLRFSLQTPFFSTGSSWNNALWFQAGNSFFISKGNWTITADAGVLKYPYKNTVTWTGNLELQKRSARHLLTTLQAERKPYFATSSSVDTVINETRVAAAIAWDNYNSWNGEVSFNLDHFEADRNNVYSVAAWGLTPPLNAWIFDFRLGYGFSYSTADENRFEPDGNPQQIIARYDPSVGIEGIYNPYFTPNQQLVNSAILNIGIHPVKGFDLGVSGNVGFFAKAQIPYFYLDTNTVGGGYSIIKDFAGQRYVPYTISAFAVVKLSRQLSLRADYNFNSTYYYTSSSAGLQLTVHLGNGKKRK